MTENSAAQMSFRQVCEQWIGNLDPEARGTGEDCYSGMGVSSSGTDPCVSSIATSGGGARSKRLADGPEPDDGPSKRRKAVRDMSESLLNSISVRAAHAINMALAPGAEPLVRGQSSLVFPRYAQFSKSPHYDLSAESRAPRRGEKRVLFPVTGGASLNLGLAGAVDLTEPLFDDRVHDGNAFQFFNNAHQQSVAVNKTSTKKNSELTHDSNNNNNNNNNNNSNNNVFGSHHVDALPCGPAGCCPKNKYEVFMEFVNYGSSQDFGCHQSDIEKLGTELLKKEPKPCPSSAFQLFSFKVLPLLRMPEEEAIDAVKISWDRLPTTDKYAFEMQRFALKDVYMNELINFVDSMHEVTRKVYLSLRRMNHAKFFGFDIYKRYIEISEDEESLMNDSSYAQLRSPCTLKNMKSPNITINKNASVNSEQSERFEQNFANFGDSGHLHFSQTIDLSFSTARNSTQNISVEPCNVSVEHHADKRPDACTSLSDLATSLSSASWHTDEECCAFEELSYVEEDATQEFDSDADGDSSQTSTVTSVVMRPTRT